MSLLNGTGTNGVAAPNPWAGRVRVLSACSPWWASSSIVAVCEVAVTGASGAAIFTALLNVARSAKSQRLFVSAHSTKRDDQWIATLHFDDAQLKAAIDAACITAAQAVENARIATPAATPSDEGLPF